MDPGSAFVLRDLKLFLEANGQDPKALGMLTELSTDKISGMEVFEGGTITQAKGEQIVQNEEIPWSTLQRTAIKLPSGHVVNPFKNRFGFGGRDTKNWRSEVRELGECLLFPRLGRCVELLFAAFKNSPWSLDEIKAYEAAQKDHIPQVVRDWVDRNVEQKLDPEARIWVYINTNRLWDPNQKMDRALSESIFNRLFSPRDLRDATPFTHFFLRFMDLSPFFPFRQLMTQEGFDTFIGVS